VKVELDAIPAHELDFLRTHSPETAQHIEDCLDWLQADPIDIRAKRHQYTNGMRSIHVFSRGEIWLIIWEEEPPGTAVIRFIGQSDSL